MPNRRIEVSLASYSLSQLQDFKTILWTLQQDGHDIPAAIRHVEDRLKLKDKATEQFITTDCPECDGLMLLHEVNISKCSQVGGGYKTQFYCNGCGHAIYMTETPLELIEIKEKE